MRKSIAFLLLVCFIFSLFTTSNYISLPSVSKTNSKNNNLSPQISTDSLIKANNVVSLSSVSQMPRLASLSNPNASWQELGPAPLENPNAESSWGQAPWSGRITAIAVNQSNPNIIYVGAAQGGVWMTKDGGNSWVPLMDNQTNLAIGSITISPDGSTILVGTGESNQAIDSYFGIGILKSVNEGQSWQLLGNNVFNQSAISSIVINSTNPNRIVASTTWAECCNELVGEYNDNGIGIFISNNGGQSWTSTNVIGFSTSTYQGVSQLVADPVNNSIIFASGYEGEVWQSNDSGSTWTQLSFGPTGSTRVAIAMSANKPDTLFSVFANTNYEISGLYSYNFVTGATTQLANIPTSTSVPYSPCNGQCWYDLIIAVDPTNANTMYFGGTSLYLSTNGGSSWSVIGGYNSGSIIHPDQHAIVFYPGNPSEIFVGNDGGIYVSPNMGTSWINLNTELRTIQFNTIAASPTNDQVLIGGTQDNGCENYNDNTIWSVAHTGDGGAALFYGDKTIICNYSGLQVAKSTDGGISWSASYSGINLNDHHLFYPPMAQDPSNQASIYIGSSNLYKSGDFGTSWSILPFYSSGEISAISVAPSNSSIIYVGDNQGILQVSKDAGSTWTQLLSTTSVFGLGYAIPISSIAIDPTNASHVYVALAYPQYPQLMETTNMGSTWTTLTNLGQIPNNISINIIKFNPITKVLFLSSDQGFYYYNGTTFNRLGSGLPDVAIFGFTFTHSNYIVLASHGRGAWLNYETPIVTMVGPANNSINLVGATVNLTNSDPNGINQSYYNWDGGSNNVLPSKISLIVPTALGTHTLSVYSQDIAGNWLNQTYSFTIATSLPKPSSSTPTTTPSSSSNSITTSSSSNSAIISSSASKKSSLAGFDYVTGILLISSLACILILRRKRNKK